jgi:hypothetical protein
VFLFTVNLTAFAYQHNPEHPIKGIWYSPKQQQIIPDKLMLFSIAASDVNEARDYFSRYSKELCKKFEQEEILIMEQTIERI